jgi:hypothetical protein
VYAIAYVNYPDDDLNISSAGGNKLNLGSFLTQGIRQKNLQTKDSKRLKKLLFHFASLTLMLIVNPIALTLVADERIACPDNWHRF